MIVQGFIFQSPSQTPRLGWLRVDDGRIVEIEHGRPPSPPEVGDEQSIISPGFYDAHTHLPQFNAIGYDGMELLDWLEQVIFPAESQWKDPAIAREESMAALARMSAAGTLGCAAYLTSHPHSYGQLCQAIAQVPMRIRAGVVLMDRNGPDELINQSRPDYSHDAGSGEFVSPSINPRFAVACSDELLAWCGEQAQQHPQLFLQTHLSESLRECATVDALFPDDEHYTAVYDRHGLLSPRTLLAHCLHLSEEEWQLIAQRGSVVVHCPGANAFLQSGVFDFDAARAHSIRLALGSDVAAGPDVAMPRVARAMIETAKLRRMTIAPDGYVPTAAEAWDTITRGNAVALGWGDCGRLEVGARADFLLLQTPFEPNQELASRLIYNWDNSFITRRVLNGQLQSPPLLSA